LREVILIELTSVSNRHRSDRATKNDFSSYQLVHGIGRTTNDPANYREGLPNGYDPSSTKDVAQTSGYAETNGSCRSSAGRDPEVDMLSTE